MPCEKQKSTAILVRATRADKRQRMSLHSQTDTNAARILGPSVVLWTTEKGIQRERLGTRLLPRKV